MKHFFILPKFLLLFTLVLTVNNAFSQRAGQLDLEFNPADTVYLGGNYSRSGPDGEVNAIATLPDCKIIIAGTFDRYNGLHRPGIARLNPDGSVDKSYYPKPFSDSGGRVNTAVFLPDGRVIIAGVYRSRRKPPKPNLVARMRQLIFDESNPYKRRTRLLYFIARLRPDGNIDKTFTPITGLEDRIEKLLIQPNGKILILSKIEKITIFSGHNPSREVEHRSKLWRLKPNGRADRGFRIGTTKKKTISSVALDPNGNIIVRGNFVGYGNTSQKGSLCLGPNGTIKSSSKSRKFFRDYVNYLAVQPDGKVLIYSSDLHKGRSISRLNIDGTIDKTFNYIPDVYDKLTAIGFQADGKILLSGDLNCNFERNCDKLRRLNPDGSLDVGFNRKTGVEGSVKNMLLQNDGKILLAGPLRSYNDFPMAFIGRVFPDGTPDTSYQLPRETKIRNYTMLAVQPDNKLLITARMRDGIDRVALDMGRLNQDGSFDSTFTPRIFAYGSYYDLLSAATAVQKDGKILLAGKYDIPYLKFLKGQMPVSWYSGNSILVRFHQNSTLDTSFTKKIFYEGWIDSLIIQPDGKILTIGWKYQSDNERNNSIERLNPDGSYDQSFYSAAGSNGKITTTVLHPDGKISVCGNFDKYQDFPRNKIARLLKNGSLDKTFDPGAGPDGEITSHVVQEDGKIIIVGKFKNYNGISRNGIARLLTNGSLDLSFDPGTGLEGYANKVLLQPDGKLLVGGNFRSYNGIPKNGLIRIHTK